MPPLGGVHSAWGSVWYGWYGVGLGGISCFGGKGGGLLGQGRFFFEGFFFGKKIQGGLKMMIFLVQYI